MKKFTALFLAVLLLFSMTGCAYANDEIAEILSEYTGVDEGTIRSQLSQNEREIAAMKRELKYLSNELLKELGIDLKPNAEPEEILDSIWDAIEEAWGKKKEKPVEQNYGNGSIITGVPIPEDEVVETLNLNISEFDPIKGFIKTMGGDQVPPEQEDNQNSDGGKFKHNETPHIDLKSSSSATNGALADTVLFLMDWIGNSSEVTLLRVKKAADGRVNIEYGSPIEARYSGKRKTLSGILVDNYYSNGPLILFTSGSMADEMIRSLFNLSGDGTYSMSMKFGKVSSTDCGYRLVLEGDTLYQIPIIQEGTEFNVYFKEEGKSMFEAGTYLFDAADDLRQLKIPVSVDEAVKVMDILRKNDIVD